MAEKENGAELLSAWMGEDGAESLQLLRRLERLKRLMAAPAPAEGSKPPALREELFARSRSENMISAAIPFLDQEYQKGIYVVVRLMELQRVLGEDWLEAREKQALSPKLRRRQLLSAVRPYLANAERERLDRALKLMELREIMELGGEK